jgi:hypothetical protein
MALKSIFRRARRSTIWAALALALPLLSASAPSTVGCDGLLETGCCTTVVTEDLAPDRPITLYSNEKLEMRAPSAGQASANEGASLAHGGRA